MRRILATALGLLMAAGCGGDTTAPPDETRNLTIQAGNNQEATAGQPVGTAPAVKVANSAGTGVAGVAVTFAVAGGGGTLTGATQTTNAQGIATVGGWTLGTAPGANSLTATLDGTTKTVTFAATGTAGAAASIEKHAGDGQTATVKTAVAVKPAVKVLDQLGNPVAGATVVFTVTGGTGTVTGGSPVSDAGGIATVGDWILGPTDGPNELSAALQGSPLAPVVFTSEGEEIVIQPSKDTTFTAGTIAVTRLIVPVGTTITVAGDLVIDADSAVEIAGAIVGACVAITINGEQTVDLTGTIDNSCADPGDDPPALTIVGKDGYTISGAGEIATSGGGRITNDPTLTDDDFPAGAPRVADFSRAARVAQRGCQISGKAFVAKPTRARVGTNGKSGGNGKDGKPWVLECRGADLDLGAGVRVFGQDGGHGGVGADLTADPANATGGDGGTGGLITLRAKEGRVLFNGAVEVHSGAGGDGGDARGTGIADKAGPKAASAKATGGRGGLPGFVTVTGDQGVSGGANLKVVLGGGGHGGGAEAEGADGLPGKVTAGSREQDGGDAEAVGGAGAGSGPKQFQITGNAAGVPTLEGGNGGKGGDATATAGTGAAAPTEEIPDGGNGGAMKATGGQGGNAEATSSVGALFGDGGNGGFARFVGGIGGNGWDDCAAVPKAGGKGGLGGSGSGNDGSGGTGFLSGDPGKVFVDVAGNGGQGGDGAPAGNGGLAGTDGIAAEGARTDVEPTFVDGAPGNGCAAVELAVDVTEVIIDHIVSETACPTTGTPIQLHNTGADPITIATVLQGSNLIEIDGSAGNGVIGPGQERVIATRFNCGQTQSATGKVVITATKTGVPPKVIEVPITVNTKRRALKLNHAVGGFSAGTVIPLSQISGHKRVAAHEPFCGYEHVHENVPGAGIMIQGTGPYGDPEPSGCGYGEVVLMTLPPAP